ncbi:MAG: type I restriction enzyme HsdR N-terminal domain-containing protein [Candidatus Cryptobacteroides sp.]
MNFSLTLCAMNGQTIWDPLRKKEVALTPEERVRQWFIGFLSTELNVPLHLMMSEVAFNFGEKKYRADILIYDRNAAPLAVVECKRPQVRIDREVARQVIRYNMSLNIRYIFITNGNSSFAFSRSGDGTVFTPLAYAPSYDEMTKGI